MSFFERIVDNILGRPRPDPYIPKKEMVEIEASELEWLRHQAKHNPSRGQIVYHPYDDKQDPEHQLFQQLLNGEKRLDQNTVVIWFNHWIKFRELLEEIAVEYHRSFHLELEGEDWPRYTFDLEHGKIKVRWTKNWEDQFYQKKELGGEFHLPTELLWSDWKQICKEELKKRQKIAEEEHQKDEERHTRLIAQNQEEQYRRAKEIVDRFEQDSLDKNLKK